MIRDCFSTRKWRTSVREDVVTTLIFSIENINYGGESGGHDSRIIFQLHRIESQQEKHFLAFFRARVYTRLGKTGLKFYPVQKITSQMLHTTRLEKTGLKILSGAKYNLSNAAYKSLKEQRKRVQRQEPVWYNE